MGGVPVLPVLIRYDSGGGSGGGAAAAGVAAAAAGAALAAVALGSAGPGGVGVAVAGAAVVTAALLAGALDGRGGVSPCWESIDASWHLLLMLAQPFHTVCLLYTSYAAAQKRRLDTGGCPVHTKKKRKAHINYS